jgi:sulfur relay (sulfurtransferase) complex TusBCD TusD component (DsrE family)
MVQVTRSSLKVSGLRLIFLFSACLFAGLDLSAQTTPNIALAWSPSPDTNVVGYNLHYGLAHGSYTNILSVGKQTNAVMTGLIAGQTYYVVASAVNAAGIESVPSNEIIYQAVTNPAPVIALTAPGNGTSALAPATFNLAAAVTANGHTISAVQFYNGTTLLGQATTAPYTFAWNNVTPGNYSLSATLVYDSGSTLGSVAVAVIVTNPLPAIAITSPANGTTTLAPGSFNLAASITPNGHTISAVQFYSGATLLGQATVAPYTFAWNIVAAGNYSLSATLIYDSGSTLGSTATSVSVTNPLPVITLASPGDGATALAPASFNLAANVTANGHVVSAVQFFDGSTLVGQASSAPYTFTWNNVAAGSHAISATLVFDAGSTLASGVATVNVTNSLPTITLTSPASATTVVAPANLNLAADVTPNGHSISAVQFYNGSTLLGQATTAPYTFAWNNISAGSYNVSATLVYDSGSTLTSGSTSFSVTNPPPVITLTAPGNAATALAPAAFTLAATVTANGHPISTVQFFNGTTLLGESTNAPYTFAWNNIAAGSYSVSATLVYDSSNTLASPIAVVNVTNAPAAGLTNSATLTVMPLPWQNVDIGTVAVAGSANFTGVVCTVQGAGNLSGLTDNFQYVYQPLTADGEIRARLSATDATATAGVMIRESLTAGSKYVFLGYSAATGKFRWQYRRNTGGSSAASQLSSATPPKVWVRLVRRGNTIYTYKSVDGQRWGIVNYCTFTMAGNIYVGLAVTSGNASTLSTVSFDNLTVTP